MSSKHFQQLDEEERALHGAWDDIARLIVSSALLAAAVWAAITLMRRLVHDGFHFAMHAFDTQAGLTGGLALLAILALGGTLRGLLTRRPDWADAGGDGMDLALANYHSTYADDADNPQPRYARPAFGLAARKATTTVLTLGSGASGGLEAPSVLIGESLAAGFARVMKVRSEHELRTYQLVGIAAAVTTLLGAPFTAALFATEIAYSDRIIYRKLSYALFAGVVAYVLNNRLSGYHPLFIAPMHAPVYTFTEYAITALVAVAVSAPVALGFGMAMKHSRALVARVHPVLHGTATALVAGLVALALWSFMDLHPSHVLGMGEETLAAVLADAPDLGWKALLAVLIGKAVTTGLTLGGGGSAGVLVPSMYLGGVSGALTAHLIAESGLAPVELDPALFAVVGIASALVAVIGVPLSAITLVLEVFGSAYGPPAILACGLTYLLTLRLTIYDSQHLSPTPAADEVG